MAWYRIGTTTVTNGSANVTGAGTAWFLTVRQGDGFIGPDFRVYEVLNVSSDTALTLATPYQGSSASGQAYGIQPTQSRLRELTDAAQQLVNDYNVGTLTAATLPVGGADQVMLDQSGARRRATVDSLVQPSRLIGKLWDSNVTAPPATLGNHDSIGSAFGGDISKIGIAFKRSITGSTTMGNPATGYSYRPETSVWYGYVYYESGHNESLNSNIGRTGYAVARTRMYHRGQGDLVAWNFSAYIDSVKAGATDVLASPAVSGINGDMQLGVPDGYLNSIEVYMSDNGFQGAAAGPVINLERTNATVAKRNFWCGFRVQSKGTQDIDQGYAVVGRTKYGIDMTEGTISQAAIALKVGQRLAFNATPGSLYAAAPGGDWIEYTAGISGLNFVVGNTSRFQINSSRVTSTLPLAVSGGGGLAILRGLQSGFALMTGTRNTGALNTDDPSLTPQRVAQYLAGLVDRIHASTGDSNQLIGT